MGQRALPSAAEASLASGGCCLAFACLSGCAVTLDYYQPGADHPGGSAVIYEGSEVATYYVDGVSIRNYVVDHHVLYLTPGKHELSGIAQKDGYHTAFDVIVMPEAGKTYRYHTGFSGYKMTVAIEEAKGK
ncbi:MAG TPA: hypothetical protein VFA75_07930 [Nevskia sp.]|jgi:hypothetical protein|nr:hypothetical protein [Nevskia sp.]